ncbi:MAG TPA: hypothetical protein VN924_12790 [Bryobacteraceae bacterium]|nr:hypothetical protein [Bryobacteraceae bacterium]
MHTDLPPTSTPALGTVASVAPAAYSRSSGYATYHFAFTLFQQERLTPGRASSLAGNAGSTWMK